MGNALPITNYYDQHATVIIYWRPRGVPKAFQPLTNGHSALIIDTFAFDKEVQGGSVDNYVSWVGASSLRRIGSKGIGATGAANQWTDDATSWGGKQVKNGPYHMPDKFVVVHGLNCDAMRTAWDNLRNKPGAHWKLVDKNCATTVARILKAGGSDALATASKTQLVWWPSDLIKYGRSMRNVVETDGGLQALDF